MFYIKNVKINNFRCYLTKEVEFSPNSNIIIGKNASGKTSLVEAVCYLCLGKSFKNAKDVELIKINKDYFNIIGNIIENEEKNNRIVIGYDTKTKKINYNGKVMSSISDYVGKYKVITFSPDDLELIKGTPTVRRRFIDINLCQIDSKYLKLLMEYKHLLKRRNEILKLENIDSKYLDILSGEIIERAKYIINKRRKIVEMLNEYIEKKSKFLTNDQEIVELEYFPNVTEEEIKNKFKNDLKIDILTKTTNNGPHRDDLNIYINRQKASIFASQGQIRTAVLAIKLGIADSFRSNNESMIIILDDVLSELDINRQIKLLESIKNGNQVFITTTDIKNIPSNIIKDSKIENIEDGE